MQKCCAFSILLAICCLLGSKSVHAQLLQSAAGGRLGPMPGSKFWRDSAEDLTFPLHFHTRVKPTALLIGRDHPNSVRFLALFPGYGVLLPLRFGSSRGFDDFGDLRPGYLVEVAEHRFGREAAPEIVIAVGNRRNDLVVNVLEYHAPELARNRNQQSNWLLEGSFTGQVKAQIAGDTISFPADPPGLSQEYQWSKGKFVRVRLTAASTRQGYPAAGPELSPHRHRGLARAGL